MKSRFNSWPWISKLTEIHEDKCITISKLTWIFNLYLSPKKGRVNTNKSWCMESNNGFVKGDLGEWLFSNGIGSMELMIETTAYETRVRGSITNSINKSIWNQQEEHSEEITDCWHFVKHLACILFKIERLSCLFIATLQSRRISCLFIKINHILRQS